VVEVAVVTGGSRGVDDLSVERLARMFAVTGAVLDLAGGR
jgi:hypothetical protein